MKIIKVLSISILIGYLLVMIILYFTQEKLLFHPTKIPKDYRYKFANPFEEINLKVDKDVEINTLLFKTTNPKGVVLFLHGNGGAIRGWGTGAGLYLENGYDVLYIDYRSYGKSDGAISSEKELINDCQKAYDFLVSNYDPDNIIISGTSIGTGIASALAKNNNPKKLILISPYYSLKSLIQEKVRIIPGFLIKYKLKTNNNLTSIKCPIFIFHGAQDQLIPITHSKRLVEENPDIDFTILDKYGHNNIPQSPEYVDKVRSILE